jgi:hypothetical protein
MTLNLVEGSGVEGSLALLSCIKRRASSDAPGGSFLTPAYFALALLDCPDPMPLLFVGRQTPPCKLAVCSEYLSGMKPLAAFRATIYSIPFRNNILLLTPVVHFFVHGSSPVSCLMSRADAIPLVGWVEPARPLAPAGATTLCALRHTHGATVSIHHSAAITPPLKGSFQGQKSGYRPRFGLIFHAFSNHFSPLPWSAPKPNRVCLHSRRSSGPM